MWLSISHHFSCGAKTGKTFPSNLHRHNTNIDFKWALSHPWVADIHRINQSIRPSITIWDKGCRSPRDSSYSLIDCFCIALNEIKVLISGVQQLSQEINKCRQPFGSRHMPFLTFQVESTTTPYRRCGFFFCVGERGFASLRNFQDTFFCCCVILQENVLMKFREIPAGTLLFIVFVVGCITSTFHLGRKLSSCIPPKKREAC